MNFDERKVYASIYFACMSAYYSEIKCEKIAEKVTKNLKKWLKNKRIVSSSEIRRKVMKELKDAKIAFHYDKHLPNLSKL